MPRSIRPPHGAVTQADSSPPPPDVAALTAPQLDLFPVRPVVEPLDPRSVVGPKTGVHAIVRVRIRPKAPVHLVFHDRHGWYCETHGPTCAAVAIARGSIDGAPA